MKAAAFLACMFVLVACGAEPSAEPEPIGIAAEPVSQPKEAEKYMLGFIDGSNDKAPAGFIVTTTVRYAGAYIAFEVFVTDPETDCERVNGYAELVSNMTASTNPRHAGHHQAALVMQDLELYVEPVCP